MSLNIIHECEKCGDNPKYEECWCKECVEELEKEAYDNGFKDGKKVGLEENNNQ